MAKDAEIAEKTPEEKLKDKEKAEHYIRLRKIRETRDYYETIMDREGRDFTFLIGQVSDNIQNFLIECGFKIEEAGNIRWKITRDAKPPVEKSDESKSDD